MKKKFLILTVAVIMIVSLLFIALPMAISSDVSLAPAVSGEAVITVDIAAMEVMTPSVVMAPDADIGVLASSELGLINAVELSAPAPAPVTSTGTGAAPLWIALSASLVIIIVSSKRLHYKILTKITGLFGHDSSINFGTDMAGVLRNGILPAAA